METDAEFGAFLTSSRDAVWLPGSGALGRDVPCQADLEAGGSWESSKRKSYVKS